MLNAIDQGQGHPRAGYGRFPAAPLSRAECCRARRNPHWYRCAAMGARTDSGSGQARHHGVGLARIGLRCEVDPSHDAPYRVDLSLSRLPGLAMVAGRLYGARSRRTRALLATEADDTALIVNLKGRHLIEQWGGRSPRRRRCGAHPVDGACRHRPPGEALALRFPGARLAPLLRGPHAPNLHVIPGST